jgi:hypothetical protein
MERNGVAGNVALDSSILAFGRFPNSLTLNRPSFTSTTK